jgi:hypothetical protein
MAVVSLCAGLSCEKVTGGGGCCLAGDGLANEQILTAVESQAEPGARRQAVLIFASSARLQLVATPQISSDGSCGGPFCLPGTIRDNGVGRSS